MKLLMPSHAKRVKHYADPVPLFQRYGAEDQLSAMYDPQVQLKSGGYIVINPTEALVSIDINSGRSTKEHGIEATALSTNLEAAREIARQLRLRDMAGLVVIDFIDMEYSSNVRKVEKAMKEALKNDRARIQVGRISSFGLMEMSRQRLRTGVLEATTRSCPHCDGTGLVRTASSAGLSALRLIEDEAAKGKGTIISLYASTEAAVYLLNAKRADLAEIEQHYGVRVEVLPEGENEGAKMRVASSGPRPEFMPRFETITFEDEAEDIEEEEEDYSEEDSRDDDGEGRSKRRRKRRRRSGRDRDDRGPDASNEDAEEEGDSEAESGSDESDESDGQRKRRRRGRRRRGGRGRGQDQAGETADNASEDAPAAEVAEAAEPAETAPTDEAPAKPKRSRKKKVEQDAEAPVTEVEAEVVASEPAAEEAPAKPKRSRKKKAEPETETAEAVAVEAVAAEEPAPLEAAPVKPKRSRKKAEPKADDAAQGAEVAVEAAQDEADAGPPRRGWWQRTFGE
jgi:ribonuclease E